MAELWWMRRDEGKKVLTNAERHLQRNDFSDIPAANASMGMFVEEFRLKKTFSYSSKTN